MEDMHQATAQPSERAPWTEPKLLVVDVASETRFFNGGAGDSNTGS